MLVSAGVLPSISELRELIRDTLLWWLQRLSSDVDRWRGRHGDAGKMGGAERRREGGERRRGDGEEREEEETKEERRGEEETGRREREELFFIHVSFLVFASSPRCVEDCDWFSCQSPDLRLEGRGRSQTLSS